MSVDDDRAGASASIPANDDAPAMPRFTRRGFMKGLGAAAVSSAAAATRGAVPAAPASASRRFRILGPGEVPLRLDINSKRYQLNVEPRETLVEVLRERLGLTGTKEACERGTCGSCTVWIGGKAVNACMALAVDLEGEEITTIEGLARNGKMHPLQEAFREHDALQCGYCTPGMIMASGALLARNPHPTLEEIKESIAGNLCRCGTYPKVYAAVSKASQGLSGGDRARSDGVPGR